MCLKKASFFAGTSSFEWCIRNNDRVCLENNLGLAEVCLKSVKVKAPQAALLADTCLNILGTLLGKLINS